MYNIAIIYPNNLKINQKYSSYRIIHYKNCEEGIAAVSLFGKLLDMLIIFDNCSFLTSKEIKILIKKQYPNLPILTLQNTKTLFDLIADDFFSTIFNNS